MTTSSIFNERLSSWGNYLKRVKNIKSGYVYNPQELKTEFGIDVDETWQGAKVVPWAGSESGYGFQFVTPEGWEITPSHEYISPTGIIYTQTQIDRQQRIYEERLALYEQQAADQEAAYQNYQAELARSGYYRQYLESGNLIQKLIEEPANALISFVPGMESGFEQYFSESDEVTNAIRRRFFTSNANLAGMNTEDAIMVLSYAMAEDPEKFMEWIGEGGIDESEKVILGAITGMSIAEVEKATGITDYKNELMPFFKAAFPETEYADKYLNEFLLRPESLVEKMRQYGWSREREGLLRALIPDLSDEEYREIFYGQYERGFFGKLWDVLKQGTGDIGLQTSSVLKLIGNQGEEQEQDFNIPIIGELAKLGETLTGAVGITAPIAGEKLQEFTIDQLAKEGLQFKVAEGIGWEFARMLPMQALLISASLATGGAAGAAIGLTGKTLSPFLSYLVQTTTSATVSRGLEAIFESGGTYDQALAMGMTPEEASEAAFKTFRENMKLVGLDAMQFTTALLPFSKLGTVAPKLLQKGLIRNVGKAAGIAGVVLSEAGEEYYQQIIQMQALGEDVSAWAISKNLSNEEIRQVTILGAMGGAAFAGGAHIISMVNNVIKSNLSPELKVDVINQIDKNIASGMTKVQAETNAFDQISNKPEFQKVVDGATQVADAQWQASQIVTDDTVRATELNQALNNKIKQSGLSNVSNVYVGYSPRAEVAIETKMELGSEGESLQFEGLKGYYSNLVEQASKVEPDNLIVKEAQHFLGGMTQENQLEVTRRLEELEGQLKQIIGTRQPSEIASKNLEDIVPVQPEVGKGFKVTQPEVEVPFTVQVTPEQMSVDDEAVRTSPPSTAEVNQSVNNSIVDEVKNKTGLESPKSTVQKLTDLIKLAEPIREVTEGLKHEELSARVGRAAAILRTNEGKEAFGKSTAALKGELPKADFSPPELQMTQEDITDLYNQIKNSDISYFDQLNTAEALGVVLSGNIPTRGQIKLLENLFGKDLAKAILDKRGLGSKIWENALDLLNLPRAVLASWDLSAPLRQGSTLFWGQPLQSLPALKPMIQAFGSERITKIVDENIKSSKYAELRKKAGLYQAPLFGVSSELTEREESFMSRLAEKVPMVKRSERAYVTYLNKLRADVFDSYAAQWEGTNKTMKDYKELANAINILSGRGSLGALNKSAPILNAVFFSPRYQASRVMLPVEFFKATPAVRKMMARNIVAFVAANFAIMGLMALAGADIEKDPRSSDFGKIKIGNTRLDFWAGFQQYARAVVQITEGVRKSSTTGALTDVARSELIASFLRSKLAPVPGLVIDILRGETYIGDELSLEPEMLRTQAFERLVPMFIQDLTEAIEDSGIAGVFVAIPGMFGVGVQTYGGGYWQDEINKLGTFKESDTLPYSVNRQEYYTTKDLWSFTLPRINGVDLENMTEQYGYPEIIKAIAEARDIKNVYEERPNTTLIKINSDIAEGDTFEQYYIQWQEYQKTEDKEQFKRDYPYYYMGNFTRQQLSLLREYHSLDETSKKNFLETHPELTVNPREEYLRSHPEENAKMALWGQAKIYTKEAYNSLKALISKLDIPENALPEMTLPPDESVDNYFTYQDMVSEGKSNSWEAQLLLSQDNVLREWLGRLPITTPIASLEIKTMPEYREIYDQLQVTGLTEAERADLYNTMIGDQTYYQLSKRVEAIEKGTQLSPIPDEIVDAHVEYYNIKNQADNVLYKDIEAKLFLIDNPDYKNFRYSSNIWGNEALNEKIDLTEVPRWRLLVSNRNQIAQFNAINDKWESMTDEELNKYPTPQGIRPSDWIMKSASQKRWYLMTMEQQKYREDNPVFANDMYKVKAYENNIPSNYINTFIQWESMQDQGKLTGYEDNWFMLEHLNYHNEVWVGLLGNDPYPVKRRIEMVDGNAVEYLENKDGNPSKVPPTRELGTKYIAYQNLDTGEERSQYRLDNPDLDEWGVAVGIWSKTMSEQRATAGRTKSENEIIELRNRYKEWEEFLRRIQEVYA